jgi:hypothetical protein
MSLRIVQDNAKQRYYDLLGKENKFPAREDMVNDSSGPQNYPFYQSLFRQAPFNIANRDMSVDGSVTPVRFSLNVPDGLIYIVHRLIFMIRDSNGMDVGGWGNSLGVPLDNGIRLGVTINGQDIDFTPIPWTSHADLAAIAYDLVHQSWGQGDEFVAMRLDVTQVGTRVRLRGDRGDTLWMEIHDDLTYLTEQRMMVQGFIENAFLN